MNYLEFVNKRNNIKQSFNESIGTNSYDYLNDVNNLIVKILKRRISDITPIAGFFNMTVEDNSKSFVPCICKYIIGNDFGCIIAWSGNANNNDYMYVHSIHFYKDKNAIFGFYLDNPPKPDLTLFTLGSSIVYFIPIIVSILERGNFNISQSEAMKLGGKVFNENRNTHNYEYYIGALRYKIYDSLSLNDINNITNTIFESYTDNPELKAFIDSKRSAKDAAFWRRLKDVSGESKYRILANEYQQVIDAVKGGANTLNDLKVALSKNVKLVAEIDDSIIRAQNEYDEKTSDTHIAFTKMRQYVNMIIKGINPALIICGAAGLGKTWNVMKQLEANGYVDGKNMLVIKGKCSTRQLYSALYNYKEKGQILVIDDADSLVGPNADENSINILKAALDSTGGPEGRLVTYSVATKIVDDDGRQLPKRFYFNGGVIVITNYQAGSLDSALRGRSFIQDIHFTTQECLDIVKGIMPKIQPNVLSLSAKQKAYEYLEKLAKAGEDMEISIRTFGICAKLYQTAQEVSDFSEDIVEQMIYEQMKLQAQKRSKNQKY